VSLSFALLIVSTLVSSLVSISTVVDDDPLIDVPLWVHENMTLNDIDDVHVKLIVEAVATSLFWGWVVISVT